MNENNERKLTLFSSRVIFMAFGFSLLLLLVLMTTTQGADLVMVGDIVKIKYMASNTLSPIRILRRNRESTRGIRSQIRFG